MSDLLLHAPRDSKSKSRINDYFDGARVGIRWVAWWKDGVQYVGSCGKTLAFAMQEVEDARQQCLEEASR